MKFTYRLYKTLVVVFCLIFSFSALDASSAEIRTVIPPNKALSNQIEISTSYTDIKYDLRSIPASANITSVTVQFRLNQDQGEKQRFSFLAKTSKGNIGFIYLNGTKKEGDLLEIVGGQEGGDALQIGAENTITYVIMDNNETYRLYLNGQTNWAPRLIITYTLSEANIPPPQDWAMSHADGSRSGRSFMRFRGATPNSFQSAIIAGTDERKVSGNRGRGPGNSNSLGDIQTDLIMFNNRVLLVANKDGNFELLAIDPITGAQKSIAGEFKKPIAMPVIDRFGHLFYFGENGIQAYKIGKDFTLSAQESISIGNNTLDQPPVLGPDGSLYLGFSNGIRSYSPYPALDLQWRYQESGSNKYSSVALNKKGTKAYFAMQNKKKVVGINTINGVEIHKAENLDLPPPTKELDDELIGQTIPLVTNKGLVFVANKLINATKMYIFSETLGAPLKTETGTKISLPAEGWPNLTQGTDRIFFVNNGKLMECLDGKCTEKATLKAGITVRSLIADQSDNVYCLSDSPNQLFVWTNGAVSKSEVMQFNPPSADIAFQRALILGPDGSPYTATSNSLYGLRAIYPNNSTYNLSSENNTGLNNYAFKAGAIVVPQGYNLSKKKYLVGSKAVGIGENVTIDGEGEITIESGGTISFENGFTVKKGATLSCKTGY